MENDTKDRVILHCDMNGCYASVELLSHPELRDRPMAVSGDPDSRHGIILAKRASSRQRPYGRHVKNALICASSVPIWKNTGITVKRSTPYISDLQILSNLSA